jgi:hypothetical protein
VKRPEISTIVVSLLLIVQLVLAFNTPDEWSIWCTASKNPNWEWITWVHFALWLLFVIGVASLVQRRLRLMYAILVIAGLAVLPLQGRLVEQRVLHCDAP